MQVTLKNKNSYLPKERSDEKKTAYMKPSKDAAWERISMG